MINVRGSGNYKQLNLVKSDMKLDDQESQKKFVFFATFNVSYKFKRQRADCCKSHTSHSKADKLLICALPYNWCWMYIWMFFWG